MTAWVLHWRFAEWVGMSGWSGTEALRGQWFSAGQSKARGLQYGSKRWCTAWRSERHLPTGPKSSIAYGIKSDHKQNRGKKGKKQSDRGKTLNNPCSNCFFYLLCKTCDVINLLNRHRPEYCQAGVVCNLLHSSLHMSLKTGRLIEGISVVDARQNESVWVGGVSRES